MEDHKVITGITEDEIWTRLAPDFAAPDDLLTYDAIIRQGSSDIRLYMDIDPGGGFEGGSEITQLSAVLMSDTDFRFAIHHEDFFDEVGKFFGMQDVEIGYPDLDKQVVIKTNNTEKIKQILADTGVQEAFKTLDNFDFGIHKHLLSSEHHPVLELNINEAITDLPRLRELYHAFFIVLNKI